MRKIANLFEYLKMGVKTIGDRTKKLTRRNLYKYALNYTEYEGDGSSRLLKTWKI